MRDEIMARLVVNAPTGADTNRQRRTLKERRKRLRDLYEMGDIEKAEYRAKCAEIDEGTRQHGPRTDRRPRPSPRRAGGLRPEDETDPAKRRELVGQLFERVWIDNSRIVAVRPSSAFAPFFNRPTNHNAAPKRSGEVESTGATGVKPG